MKNKRFAIIAGSIALLLFVGVASGVGAFFGNRIAKGENQFANFPPLELNAGTSTRTKSMSMATGLVDGNVEGLFVLDHLTGNLQCWLLNTRTGNVGGIYRANVANDLAIQGKAGQPEYMMVTGNFFFSGGNAGNNLPGQSICYVGDASTGNVVGYGVVYNKQSINRGIVQQGLLNVVCKGTSRQAGSATRDQ